jgi:glycosyltransferase involved in cell wall biosynthesis
MLGYPTYRRWILNDDLPGIVASVRPDVAVVQASDHMRAAQILDSLGVPVIVYFHDVLFHELDGDPRELKNALFLANSRFTADKYRQEFGIASAIIPPIFRAGDYRAPRAPENITMINPRPQKGSELVLKLVAACPDIPFCLVESWELSAEEKAMWHQQMQRHPNLTLRARTMDMADVYRRAKLVLVPSKLEEAWGRVASEAQFSGIPVIASNRGGLPEAVGPGGVLLDPDRPELWVEAIRKLWDDEQHYSQLSAAAVSHAGRAEIDPRVQVDGLLRLAEKAIEHRRAAGGVQTKKILCS